MEMKYLIVAFACIVVEVASNAEDLLCDDGSCRDVEDEALLQFHASKTGKSHSSHCNTGIDTTKNFCCWSKTCNGDADCCSSCGPEGACQFPDGHGFGVSDQGTCANDPANQCLGSGVPPSPSPEKYCDIEVDTSMNFCCWSKTCNGDPDCCSSCGPAGACQFPDGDGYGISQQGTCTNTPQNQCPGLSNDTDSAVNDADDGITEVAFCDIEVDKSQNFCCWSKTCNGDAECCSSCGPQGACQFPDGDGFGSSQQGTCVNDLANQCAGARLVQVNATQKMKKEVQARSQHALKKTITSQNKTKSEFCDKAIDYSKPFCCWSSTCNGDADCCSSCGPEGACQFPDGDGFGVNDQGTCANDPANQCLGSGVPPSPSPEKYCDIEVDTSMNFCCWSKTCNGDPDCCSSCGPEGACQFPDGDGYGSNQQGTCTNTPQNQCPGLSNDTDSAVNDTDDGIAEVAFCDIEVDKSQNFCCWSKTCNGDAECCGSCGPQGACQFPDGDGFGSSQQGTCVNDLANQCAGARLVQVNATQKMKKEVQAQRAEGEEGGAARASQRLAGPAGPAGLEQSK